MSWTDKPDINAGAYPTGAELEEICDKIEDLSQGAVYAATSSPGSGTTTTEVKDASGDVAFTAITGYDYQITFTASAIAGAGGGILICQIRDGGTSSPTNASTSVAATVAYCPAIGFAGQVPVTIIRTINCPTDIAAGVHTIAAFYVRGASGVATTVQLENAGSNRQLSVHRIGG